MEVEVTPQVRRSKSNEIFYGKKRNSEVRTGQSTIIHMVKQEVAVYTSSIGGEYSTLSLKARNRGR